MDEMREKVEGMQAQIEEADQMIRDLQGTICLLENQKAELEEKNKVMEASHQFQCGKIEAYETVFRNVWRK